MSDIGPVEVETLQRMVYDGRAGGQVIRMTLEIDQPVEMSDFVAAFTSIAAEYDRYAKRTGGGDGGEATLYVKRVESGSIIADLVPWMATAWATTTFMGQVLDAETFVRTYGERLLGYLKPGGRAPDAGRPELTDFLRQTAAISNNPGSTLKVAALELKDGEYEVRAAFQFDTGEAREIQQRVDEHRREIEHRNLADYERVAMRFTRTDTGSSKIGKRSGEKAIIEAISPKPRPVIYASEMTEQAIKQEIREGDDNVYKKAFVVDVNVELQNGRPWAYRVTELHQVIELDDEDDD